MFDGPAKSSAKRPHIVGLGGTTRIGSSSEAALRYTMGQIAEMGASTELIAGPLIDLPMYDPADAHRSPSARRLVQSLRRADGVVIATPSYHGALSGVIKNALDYVEDLRGDARPYFDGRAVGILITAHGAQALGTTLVGVRAIVHALRGWPTPFAATLNGQSRPFENGLPANEEVAGQLRTVAQQVYEFACAQQILRERLEPTRAMAAVGT
jgi:FMN reductase